MSALDWSAEGGIIILPEVVTLETIPKLIKSKGSLRLPVMVVDFCNVTQVDSAALALLLIWSNNINTSVRVKNVLPEIQTLIQLYDLESVIVAA